MEWPADPVREEDDNDLPAKRRRLTQLLANVHRRAEESSQESQAYDQATYEDTTALTALNLATPPSTLSNVHTARGGLAIWGEVPLWAGIILSLVGALFYWLFSYLDCTE